MIEISMRCVFFVIALSFSALDCQEDGSLWSVEVEFNASLFDYADENYTYPLLNEESSAPCKSSIRGLSSLGLMITYVIVSVLSVLGNAVVIYVVCHMEGSRTTTDVFLMHLALADLVFALTLPFWAVYVNSQWIFGTFLCKLLSGLQEASFYGGVFLLACISVDRYLAIVKATWALNRRRHLAGAACGGVWLAAAALSLPAVLQKEAARPDGVDGETLCYENVTAESGDRRRTGVRVLRHALGFFLPLAVMAFCYGCAVGTLFRARTGQKYKAMRVILAVVLAFVLCWLPHNVSVLVDTLMRDGSLFGETCALRNGVRLATHVTEVVAFTHCAVNPFLYAFVGQKFRNELLVALYKHGVLSKKTMNAYKKGSTYSSGSRNTSVTL